MASPKKLPVKPSKQKPENHSDIPQSNEGSSSQTTVTTSSEAKRKRGPTEMHKIQKKKKKGKRLVVEFSRKGEAMGKVGKQYASYTGVMARTIIPIHLSNWAAVDDHLKEKIWTEITVILIYSVFELPPESKQSTLQSASTKWRQFKSTLIREYVLPHKNDPEALKEPPEMYDFIELSDWQSFVISRLSENWQEIHQIQKERRNKCKYHHRTGRKGYVGVVEELVNKKIVTKDEEVDRALLWKVAREDKNGKIVDEEVAELAGTIEKLLKEKEEGLITVSGYNDVLAMALGTPEHAGRVRGVGGFVKPSAFFNIPRKKRECVSKGMLKERDVLLQETKKLMEEQQKKHEAAQELLQKQIEMLKVAISGQPCNVSTSVHIPNISPMSEKASTNIPSKFVEFAAVKEVCEDGCDDVVEQTEVEANKGKDCKLAFGSKDNIVASGTIVDINVPEQLIHNVPLGEGNVRVSINYALKGASPLPIPVKGVLNTVEDAVGSQVAWPEDLIVFVDDIVEKKKKTTKEKFAKSLFQAIPETVPKSCKILYGFAQKVMSQGQTLSSYIDEDIFGVEKMIYVLKEDIISFIHMNEIGQAVITAYISYLYKLVKDQEWEPKIAFMDPSRTFHDPNSLDEAGRVQYIVKALNQASIDSVFLIPYNPGAHWILTIIDEERDNVYIMDPLGARHPHDVWKRIVNAGIKQFNAEKGRGVRKPPTWIMLSGAPKQADGKTCGYCVMRYMKEICEDSSLAFRTKYASRGKKKAFYTQMELDEVRDEWACHVLEWI